MIFEYRGKKYPEFLKNGNARKFIEPFAQQFCQGYGLDVGCGKWPLYGAEPIDIKDGKDAMALPQGFWPFIFSSHCLEHLENPIAALEHWKTRLAPGAPLFLYLPHPDMEYWQPQNCRKHLHSWAPAQMAKIISDLGFVDVIHSERDLLWSFCVVGWKHE